MVSWLFGQRRRMAADLKLFMQLLPMQTVDSRDCGCLALKASRASIDSSVSLLFVIIRVYNSLLSERKLSSWSKSASTSEHRIILTVFTSLWSLRVLRQQLKLVLAASPPTNSINSSLTADLLFISNTDSTMLRLPSLFKLACLITSLGMQVGNTIFSSSILDTSARSHSSQLADETSMDWSNFLLPSNLIDLMMEWLILVLSKTLDLLLEVISLAEDSGSKPHLDLMDFATLFWWLQETFYLDWQDEDIFLPLRREEEWAAFFSDFNSSLPLSSMMFMVSYSFNLSIFALSSCIFSEELC